MKTVMKKMFCLLLVAVLLVSAVPAAFADASTAPTCDKHPGSVITRRESDDVPAGCVTPGKKAYKCAYKEGEADKGHVIFVEIPAAHTPGSAPTCSNPQKCTVCGTTLVEALGHTPGAAETCSAPQTCTVCGGTLKAPDATKHSFGPAATCTTPQTCTICGGTLAAALNHDPGPAATCTTAQTCKRCGEVLEAAKDHDYDSTGACRRCTATETSTHEVYFSVNGNQDYWHLGVKHNQTVANPGFTYGTDYTYLNNINDTDTHEFMGWSKNPSATRGSDLEDIVLNPVTQSVTYYAIYRAKETTNSGSTDTGNGGSNNSGSNNSGSGSIGDDGLVKVHVTLHTGNTETATVELLRYKDASTRKIYASVAAHEDLIRAELAEKYPGYEWSGNVYDDPSKNQNMTETIGEGTTVYINAYTGQDMILIYVHKNRTFEPDRIIQMQGKKIGQTVTKSEVTKAVSKYYSVNSLSMYTEDDWEKLVNGKSVESASSIKVMDDDYFIIDVKISGSAKSTSGSGAKADSTNPKTGDAIFAPAMILGMSASALVVLYYLNKKRAF